jgi:sugar phosphate permease
VSPRNTRWARLAPLVFITYSLAYLDRVNYGFGAAGGLAKSLGITSAIAALLGATFFAGYFLFQIPGAIYAESRSARRLLFWSLILWGVCAGATGLITNIPLLFVDRFVLGVVESAVLPALLIFISHWFTRTERSRMNAILILGNPVTVLWASIVSGYLVERVSWQAMFVVEGIPAIVWAFVWNAIVRDDPKDAPWLPKAERDALDTALAAEQRALVPAESYAAAFRRPTVVLLAAQYFFWSVGIYAFVLWLPSIVRTASSLGISATGWLTAIPYAVGAIAMVVVSAYSDRSGDRKRVTAISLFIGAIAFTASFTLGTSHFALSFATLVIAGAAMYAPYGPFFAIVPEILPRNVAGPAMALVNSCGALGGFVGTYLVGWLNGTTGSPTISYGFLAASLFVSVALTLALRLPNLSTASVMPRASM